MLCFLGSGRAAELYLQEWKREISYALDNEPVVWVLNSVAHPSSAASYFVWCKRRRMTYRSISLAFWAAARITQ